MDGDTRRTGAVGALRGYRQAMTVARAVMERLPHVLVVGDGRRPAGRGDRARAEDLLTEEAERVWRDGLAGRDVGALAGSMLAMVARHVADPERAAGTVDVLARDASGSIASAVSTSGWAWKYPGRLGDSPVIGAGNYADSRLRRRSLHGLGRARHPGGHGPGARGRAGRRRAAGRGLPAGHGRRRVPRHRWAPADHEPGRARSPAASHAGWSTEPERTYVFWEEGMDRCRGRCPHPLSVSSP